MTAATVQTLLVAVRRRLWRMRLAAAMRRACWACAVWLLLIAAAHLLAGRVAWGLAVGPAAAIWAVLWVRAVWLAPTEPACALWADRQLDGASAYTTWLELHGAAAPAPPAALRSLDAWAGARVPHSLALLADRAEELHLVRPWLTLLVAAALATTVLALPGAILSPTHRPFATTAPTAGPEQPAAAAHASEATDLASEVASALRAESSRETAERRPDRTPATGSNPPHRDTGGDQAAAAPAPAAVAAGARAGSEAVPSSMPIDAAATGSSRRPVLGAGPDVGASADDRSESGASRVVPAERPVQRSAAGERERSQHWQSDPRQAGSYDDERAIRGVAADGEVADPPAATPPPAGATARLSPSEASYVQAWMKASAQQR